MKQSHLDPSETIQALRALGARKMMIQPWGTFRLGDEPVYDSPLQLQEALRKAGLPERWIRAAHGQTCFVAPNGTLQKGPSSWPGTPSGADPGDKGARFASRSGGRSN